MAGSPILTISKAFGTILPLPCHLWIGIEMRLTVHDESDSGASSTAWRSQTIPPSSVSQPISRSACPAPGGSPSSVIIDDARRPGHSVDGRMKQGAEFVDQAMAEKGAVDDPAAFEEATSSFRRRSRAEPWRRGGRPLLALRRCTTRHPRAARRDRNPGLARPAPRRRGRRRYYPRRSAHALMDRWRWPVSVPCDRRRGVRVCVRHIGR